MPYIANNPAGYNGQVIGDGQCVAFVKLASGAPQTNLWKQGPHVRGSGLAFGTAIATFQGGHYTNNPKQSHAAIYVSQDQHGITVWDQWKGKPVHERVIRFHNGQVLPVNDGDAFSVID